MKLVFPENITSSLIIGDPVSHSLSPAMHNAAYGALGIADQFTFFAAQVRTDELAEVIAIIRTKNVRGLTCTMPHKVAVIDYLDEIDDTAKQIGAVNTVVHENGLLKGFNTDWLGIITPLAKIGTLRDKRAAVIGAGGAARAAVYGLTREGVKVTIFNRTAAKAFDIAQSFSCLNAPLEEITRRGDFDIVINTTPLGASPLENFSPLPIDCFQPGQVVFDIVYTPYQTKFLRQAQQMGGHTLPGLEMLLYQGAAQFELYTGYKAPEEVMRNFLEKNLKMSNR